ncbi:Hypothetical_protein [Hexamita inflata]|uniref:Hypothetical_protein n=1 Tax=Hexamita inflata TaxID=28002 RepID=A0ABP1HDL7_9EUKA
MPPRNYVTCKFLIFSVIIQTYFLKTKSRYWLIISLNKKFLDFPYKSGKQKYVTQALIIIYFFHSDFFKQDQAYAYHLQHSCYDKHLNEITTFIHWFKDIGRVSTEEKKTSRNVQTLLSWNSTCQKEPFLGQMISSTHLQMVGTAVYHESYTKSNDLKISM